MAGDVLVVAEHLRGELDDVTFELLGMGRELAGQLGGSLIAALIGGSGEMADQLGAADLVVSVGGADMSDFNPESHGAALEAVVDAKSPRAVLVSYTSMGMDLASTLAVKKGMAHAAFGTAVAGGENVTPEGGKRNITATSQLYGGKMDVVSDLGDGPCVVSVLAGSAPADAGRADGPPAAKESLPAPATAGHVRFKRLIEPEAGDVDITAQDVLVAIGRGIGSKDDVEVAEELAEALDAAVAGSRPLIDAGWLPKTRQVGKSGLKVSPKVYLALGISGAPEHIEGMKSAATIIAVNTDEQAPIFNFAHYGMKEDLFDVCEELTEAIEDR
ncbi:MAG: electron transfer flavoprotein subunit alpha/FixB family protein [bacterium]|nr:electron transfer flavoprotein subunit alpha/FixB family protein [bacterium]